MAPERFLSLASSSFSLIFLSNVVVSFCVAARSTTWFREHSGSCIIMHFYFHDTVSSPKNATVVRIAGRPYSFGATLVADDALTAGPVRTSKLVGRAQGMYSSAAQTGLAFLMVFNFVFLDGKYGGSSISIQGQNDVNQKVREMPVIGGSGLLRDACGYVLAQTHWLAKNGDAILEYTVNISTSCHC